MDEDFDLVAEYERIEQEKLNMLLTTSNVITKEVEKLCPHEEDIVEVIDDLQELFTDRSFEYEIGNAKFLIRIFGLDNNQFKIAIPSYSIEYTFNGSKLKTSAVSVTKQKSYPEIVYQEVFDIFTKSTFEVIKDVFAIYLSENDYSFNMFNGCFQITIRLRNIYIKSDFIKTAHLIPDIMYILSFNGNWNINGARPTVTQAEHNANYTHSHFANGSKGRQNICLGSGIMNNIIGQLNLLFSRCDIDTNRKIVAQYISAIESMAKYQDDNGGPYARYENIRANRHGTSDLTHRYIETAIDIVDQKLRDNKFQINNSAIRPKQITINNKSLFYLTFDSKWAEKTLESLGVPKTQLGPNNHVVALNDSNDSSAGNFQLNYPIHWKDTVIRSGVIIPSDDKELVSVYPNFLIKWITIYMTSLINSKLKKYDKENELHVEPKQ